MDDRPIGVFDSGFGGLTVARAVVDLLPAENLVYIGDTGRYPYGPRRLDEVRRFSAQITRKLIEDHGVKLVVVACNTAAAAGLDGVRDLGETAWSASSSRVFAPLSGRRSPGVSVSSAQWARSRPAPISGRSPGSNRGTPWS
jgi:hypothetical protein